MNRRSSRPAVWIVVALAWLCGCSVLPPRPDPSRFYTLSPTVDTGEGSPQQPQTVLYGLGPIDLPQYLDRDEVAERMSSAEVRYSRIDFWAEPLKTNLTRVLLQDLSTLLGADRIVLYPWPSTVAVDYQIIVTFLRFERTAAGETELRARWTIRNPRTGEYLGLHESNLTRSASSPVTADAVDALSADVGDLSREIAAALRKLPAPRQPPSAKKEN
jgi:uncharacterized lipoprotein YmbA